MRYNFIPLAATTVVAVAYASSANVAVPDGCTHQSGWANAIVQNKCSNDVYYILDNSVGGKQTISSGSSITVPVYQKNADKGGMSIKLFKDPNTDMWSSPSITQFELTATDMLYFDISNVNSNIGTGMNGNGQSLAKPPPFMNDGLLLQAGTKSIECKAGQNPCAAAYSNNNDDWATSAVSLSTDVTLTICTGGSSSGSSNGNSNPPPSSSPAPAATKPVSVPVVAQPLSNNQVPKVEQKNAVNDNDVVYVTQTVMAAAQQVTVFARAPAEEKEKRAEHLHQHVHNKIHKRRHEA